MTTVTKTDAVWFTTKGQVVIPSWLRKQFDIEEGTKCVVQATDDGILLKPVTAALIRRGRGILKRSASPEHDRATHKKTEIKLEDRYAS
jgi:AbrB family looped-hinge helix DNA binding protein